jgi:tetratricopeptide (TPR) repeat protein
MSRTDDTLRHLLMIVILSLVWASCGPQGEPAPIVEPGLEPIPQPDIAAAEPPVRQQLSEERNRLDTRLLEGSDTDPELALAFGRLGLLYHAYDLLDPAEACYRNARRIEPEESDWAYLLGLVYQRRGRLDEAKSELEVALALQPSDAPTLLHLGQVEQANNRLNRARSLFNQALAAEPACHAARFGLGEIARSSGDLAGAADHFAAVLEGQPGALQVHYPLAQVLMRLGRDEEATPHLDFAGERSLSVGGRPNCPDPLDIQLADLRTGSAAAMRRGLQLGLAGEGAQELELLLQAVENDQNDFKSRQRVGNIFLQRGDLEAARDQYQEAVRLAPDNPELHSNLGVVYTRMGESGLAEERFRAALAIHPDSSHYQLQLAATVQTRGNCQEAVDLYSRILAIEPAHRLALLQRGLCLSKLGRISEAGDDMALLIQVHPPEDPAQHLQMASMLFSLGHEEEAVRHFQSIATSEATAAIRAQAHVLIGRTHLMRGDQQEAERSFRTASQLDPNLPQPPPPQR